jgi:adenosylcobinamide kinase/adenosylcobinamide-phosphate guanylyltransferase
MAKEIVLVTGGARSGKSRYAEQRARELGSRRLYIATAEAKDDEMHERIAAHQKRRGVDWTTVEEPVELSAALLAEQGQIDCALVDCLTLWLSNLLLCRDEKYAQRKVAELVQTLPRLDFHIVLVGASCRTIPWAASFATLPVGPIKLSRTPPAKSYSRSRVFR